jgi:hypothetical protein
MAEDKGVHNQIDSNQDIQWRQHRSLRGRPKLVGVQIKEVVMKQIDNLTLKEQ